jgi:hypothetical protein
MACAVAISDDKSNSDNELSVGAKTDGVAIEDPNVPTIKAALLSDSGNKKNEKNINKDYQAILQIKQVTYSTNVNIDVDCSDTLI